MASPTGVRRRLMRRPELCLRLSHPLPCL